MNNLMLIYWLSNTIKIFHFASIEIVRLVLSVQAISPQSRIDEEKYAERMDRREV
jgi:hypothetical protein